MIHRVADTLFAQNLAVELGSVMNNKKIQLLIKESSDMVPFVSLKVYMFPQINLVWIGVSDHDDRFCDEYSQPA